MPPEQRQRLANTVNHRFYLGAHRNLRLENVFGWASF
jgi:hypothetical protein